MHEVWRQRLNQWLLPLASRVTVSPNAITAAALALNRSAAAALAAARREPSLFLVGALVLAFAGLLDALDGAVARARNLTSRFGDFLDHLFDRISDVGILVGWCVGAAVRPAVTIAAVVAVMLNGYIGTQIEATFGKRRYAGTGRAEFVVAAFFFPLLQFGLLRGGIAERLFAGFTIAEWLTIVIVAFAAIGLIQRFGLARTLSR